MGLCGWLPMWARYEMWDDEASLRQQSGSFVVKQISCPFITTEC